MPKKSTDELISKMKDLHKQGLYHKEIALELGTSEANVWFHLRGGREFFIRKPVKNKRKISDEVKNQILPLHQQGFKDSEIAENLNIGLATVFAYLKGKRERTLKPKQEITSRGTIICSICKEEKEVSEFRAPRSNGSSTSLSRSSFCLKCMARKRARKFDLLPEYMKFKIRSVSRRAARLGLPFNLTVEQLESMYERQNGLCFYTGEVMRIGSIKEEQNFRSSMSLDQVIYGKGYSEQNVVLCSYRANAIKQDMSLTEMAEWMPGWYAKLKACPWLSFG